MKIETIRNNEKKEEAKIKKERNQPLENCIYWINEKEKENCARWFLGRQIKIETVRNNEKKEEPKRKNRLINQMKNAPTE